MGDISVPVVSARLCGAEPGLALSGLDVDDRGADWIDAAVPGDVRAALVDAGRLEDPDRDASDELSAWVDALDWWYRFELPAFDALGPDETVVLRFDGIDTFATVFVDGTERARSTNMFRTIEVDVTSVVASPGRHVVAVLVERPWARLGLSSREFEDRRADPRARVRKAQFGWGWDFAPNQPSIGLWRPVTVERRQRAWIESVRFQTLRLDGAAAVVAIDAFIGGGAADGRVSLRLAESGGTIVVDTDARVVDGVARVVAVVDNAQLWWPHTHGEPALHRLRVVLEADGVEMDEHVSSVGIRTVTLDESPNPDEPGLRFFRFVVNGRPIFAKGANWVPCDVAVGTVNASRYAALLEAAREANMNMVRVWGGGVYEHDAFYESCDELGLLVWQEFMFACVAPHDDDAEWLDDIRAEATDQVRRLRSHACLALWCGNNEIEALAMMNGAGLTRSPGARIFNEVLPEVVAAEDGVLGYVPTSPMLGNGSDQADRHNWDVWHGIAAAANREISADTMAKMFAVGVDLDVDSADGQAKARSMSADQYLADASRFPSEFGLRSMPARPTLAHWIDEEHLVLGDPQITARNRDRLGPTNKIELAASTVAGRVASLDDLIDFSQLTQAEGLKLGCEHFRRRWPSCAGALIWQLDDCWPAPTWSLIDHAGRGKGALAYAKRFYAPVATSFARDNQGAVSLWVVNDTAETVDDVLTVRLSRLAGADAWSEEVAIAAPPASSTCVASWVAVDVEAGADCALLVASASGRIPNNRLFFVPPKDLQRGEPKVNATFAETDGRVAVTVETDAYALFVHVIADDPAVRFDDNYFDLEAGDTRTVTSLGKTSIDELSVRWL